MRLTREFLRAIGGLAWAVVLLLAAGAVLTLVTLAWGWLATAG